MTTLAPREISDVPRELGASQRTRTTSQIRTRCRFWSSRIPATKLAASSRQAASRRGELGGAAVWCLAAAALAWTNAAAAATPLCWRLPPGTLLNVQLTQTTRTETTVKDSVLTVRIESGFDVQWAVDRVETNGTMRLTQAFTRLWLKTVSPDGKATAYDSASCEGPAAGATAIAGAVRTLLRIRIGMSLSSRGEILDVQRSADMDSLLGDLPAQTGWKTLLTKEGLGRALHQALGSLPEGPVNVGDQWTRTRVTIGPLGKIVATETYTYEGPGRDGARVLERIRVATKVNLAGDATAPAAAGRLPREELEGVYWFDATAGFLVESRLTQTLLTEVPYAGGNIQVKTVSSLCTRLTREQHGKD